MPLDNTFAHFAFAALAVRAEESSDSNTTRLVFINDDDEEVVVEYRRHLRGWTVYCEVRVDGDVVVSHGEAEDYRAVFNAARERAFRARDAEQDAKRAATHSRSNALVSDLSKRATSELTEPAA